MNQMQVVLSLEVISFITVNCCHRADAVGISMSYMWIPIKYKVSKAREARIRRENKKRIFSYFQTEETEVWQNSLFTA